MRNIYVLPTDKPSRLINSGKEFNLLVNSTIDKRCVNIYITSDEKIKEGDWYCSPNGIVSKHNGTEKLPDNWNKVILTTDQDLIKDGVQAIDDNFLEWFVKNPNCEWIDVESINIGNDKLGYIICKPKEEPKEETIRCYHVNTDTEYLGSVEAKKEAVKKGWAFYKKEEPKQETLEEAACIALGYDYKNWINIHSKDISTKLYLEVINWCKGAKWQAERMYSEEEVLGILRKSHSIEETSKMDSWITKWFEQFKNK